MKFKNGGIIHQLVTAFGIFDTYLARTICSTFWLIVAMLAITLGIGGLAATALGHILASLAVLAVTGFPTTPAIVLMSLTFFAAIGVTGCYLYNKVTESNVFSETTEFVGKAYTAHKEKHCVLVTFDE